MAKRITKFFEKNAWLIIVLTLAMMIGGMALLAAGAVINDPYNITTSCNGFTCSALNVTVFYPNSTLFVNNQPMTSNGIYAYRQLTPPVFGAYDFVLYDGANYSEGSFSATGTGTELQTGESVIYLVFFALLAFLFFANLILIGKFPMGNQRDESGIVTVTNMKYVTMVLVYIEWLFIFAMLFIAYNLAQAFLAEQLVADYLFMLFRVVFGLTIIFTLLWFFWIIWNIIQDKQIKQMFTRGLPGSGRPGMSKY